MRTRQKELHVLALALLLGCTRNDNLAWSHGHDLDAGDADAGDADVSDAEQTWALDDAGVAYCGSTRCACSNGLDDDSDGLTDGFDPECTGAFDQYEDSFATGVHGESQDPKCQDCFFDSNSGRDEGCSRPRECALEGREPSGGGACRTCEVSASCAGACQPLVPNGCDCFGCCGVWRRGEPIAILLRPSCSMAVLDDLNACPRCIPAADCQNPCGECELCPGRGLAELPESCRQQGNAGYSCDDAQVCTSDSCRPGEYCQQGCCMEIGF